MSLHSTVNPDPALKGVRAFFAPEGQFPKESYAYGKILVSEQLKGITDKGEVSGANFLILKSSPVPAVMLELGYLSNPIDKERLNDPRKQQLLAAKIYTALEKIKEAAEK